MNCKSQEHPLFEKVTEDELEKDIAADLLFTASEESKKVARNKGQMFRNVYKRRSLGL